MNNKLLIVNTTRYVPMGSFGICDYLAQNKVVAKLINSPYLSGLSHNLLALLQYIDEYLPTHICILFHWKESLKDFIYLGEYLQKLYPRTKLFTGGFTASYFAESILTEYSFLDCVIVGDPEVPTLYLMQGIQYENIPNLVYRENAIVHVNKNIFRADQKMLSKISFSKLDYLVNYKQYLKEIDQQVGFPIFIGRMCKYDCLFCGGSARAFVKHSSRKHFVVRSVKSIIKDLLILKQYTDFIYIGYESSQAVINKLLKIISRHKQLKNYFYIAYSTWGLLRPKQLMLLLKAFRYDESKKSIIEISPETSLESDRKLIRDPRLYYSNKQLIKNVMMISELFDSKVRGHLFFSRYHITQNTVKKLNLELDTIINLRKQLGQLKPIWSIFYMHLATDVGSYYWEKNIREPKDIKSLLREIDKKIKYEKNYGINFDNYCFFYSEALSEEEIFEYEQLVQKSFKDQF